MVVAADIKTAERLVEQGVLPSSILLRARKGMLDDCSRFYASCS